MCLNGFFAHAFSSAVPRSVQIEHYKVARLENDYEPKILKMYADYYCHESEYKFVRVSCLIHAQCSGNDHSKKVFSNELHLNGDPFDNARTLINTYLTNYPYIRSDTEAASQLKSVVIRPIKPNWNIKGENSWKSIEMGHYIIELYRAITVLYFFAQVALNYSLCERL